MHDRPNLASRGQYSRGFGVTSKKHTIWRVFKETRPQYIGVGTRHGFLARSPIDVLGQIADRDRVRLIAKPLVFPRSHLIIHLRSLGREAYRALLLYTTDSRRMRRWRMNRRCRSNKQSASIINSSAASEFLP